MNKKNEYVFKILTKININIVTNIVTRKRRRQKFEISGKAQGRLFRYLNKVMKGSLFLFQMSVAFTAFAAVDNL